MRLTARVEDYLEAILEIEMSGEVATVTQIAKNLGVTKATVTAALKRLKIVELLEHERYGDVILTEEGRKRALVVYRRHEFLTDFFVRILGFSRKRAQQVACVMEHEIDEVTEKRLAAFTDAISVADRKNEPWVEALLAKLNDTSQPLPVPLCMVKDGTSGVIARLTAQHELRKRLISMGLVTGVELRSIKKSDAAGSGVFSFVFDKSMCSIGIAEASAIWIYEQNGD